jgi:hypothetical protein
MGEDQNYGVNKTRVAQKWVTFYIQNPNLKILMISTTETINPAPDIIKSLTILRLTLGSGLSK